MTPLFGILQLDRGDPLGYANLPGLFQVWLQDAGSFAAAGLVLYLLYALITPTDQSESEKLRVPVSRLMAVSAGLAFLCYAPFLGLFIADLFGKEPMTTVLGHALDAPSLPPPPPGMPIRTLPPVWHWELRPMGFTIAGLFAVIGIGELFVRDLIKMRIRRLWALSRIGFQEAVRSRFLFIFLIILPLFLFRNVFLAHVRPSDEFRILVSFGSTIIALLVLVVGAILAAFSLPTDLKTQTIHTVVTKPVERIEVLLGRFFGYAGLMTVVLIVLTLASLLLINTSTVDPAAEEESAKARVTVRGKLRFEQRRKVEGQEFQGTNVGREFDYRRYIAGQPESGERAVWYFANLGSGLGSAAGDRVPVEFTFDIFRLTAGDRTQVERGVDVTFTFATAHCPQVPPRPDQGREWLWVNAAAADEYRREVAALRERGINPVSAKPGTPAWEAASKLAEKFGFYEIRGKKVRNHMVMSVDVPAGLFRNAEKPLPKAANPASPTPPLLSVYVKCETPGQMLGMAEPDLYILETNQTFTVNFVKGMIGLWCRLCIIIALAVACSTYLSGVLSLIVALGIFLLGNQAVTDLLNDIATNRSIGGGPAEAFARLVKTEQPTAPTSDSTGTQVLVSSDRVFAWIVRRFQPVIPGTESLTWARFVSEGYNVNAEYLLVNVIVTFGYLLPWAVLGYYLLRSREIAA